MGTVHRAMADLSGDSGLAGIPFVAMCAWADRVGVDVFWLCERVRAVERAYAEEDGAADE